MKRAIGLGILAAGIGLLLWGMQSSDSFSSEVSEFFTGNPTDEAMWLTIGGIAAIICGAAMALLGGKRIEN